MLQSMTAFARSQTETSALRLVWELKSVNHRFLEAQFRLPEQFRPLEAPLRETVRRQLKRGKLDCVLHAQSISAGNLIELNRPLLLQLLAVLEQVRRDAPEMHSANPMDLLRWPGILGETGGIEAGETATAVIDLFEQALNSLIDERRREGRELAEAIATRLDAIDEIAGDLQSLAEGLASDVQNRLTARLEELAVSVDPARLEQEVALLAQKADVAEELDRLRIHVAEAHAQADRAGPHGRRLDFLAQELHREANTLGAKALLPETASRTVDLKVIIEQIREQAQNVE